jgi:hypothetical protein
VAQAAIATATEPQQRDGSRTVTVTPRSIPVAHGQTIVVRSVKPQDEPGLADLYDGLDVGDRYLRFFCSYRPSRDCPTVCVSGRDVHVVRNRPGDATWETLTRSHSATHPNIPVIVDSTGDHEQTTPLEDIRVPALFHFYLQTSAGATGNEPEP